MARELQPLSAQSEPPMEVREQQDAADELYHARHDNRVRRRFALFLMLAFLAVFALMVAPFFEALLLAAVFSALLYPAYGALRKRLPGPDGIAALITTVLALAIVVAPLTVLIGVLTREAASMSEAVAPWIDGRNDAEQIASVVPEWLPYRQQILGRTGDVVDQIGTFVFDRLTDATQSTLVFLVNLFVLLYAMFFFFLRGQRLLEWLAAHTPLIERDKQIFVTRGVAITRATLKSVLVIGAIQGVLGGIGFAFAGIDAPVFWGIVMMVASALPTLGTALVWIPACVGLLLAGETVSALALLAWCALAVSSVDNLLRPHLIGSDVRMPDLLVLLSTLGGIALFGFAGIIIGPVLAGLFLTSLDIFAATYEHEIRDGAGEPVVIAATSVERDAAWPAARERLPRTRH